MIRAGTGLILGVFIVIMLQVNQIHGERIAESPFENDTWASNSSKIIEPLGDHYKATKNINEALSIQLQGFEPFTEEFEPVIQTGHRAGNFELYHPEKRKLQKLMQFLIVLKFVGNNRESLSYRISF